MTYQIRNEQTNEIIENGLTIEGVDSWWQKNEGEFFGVRVEGSVILVARMP